MVFQPMFNGSVFVSNEGDSNQIDRAVAMFYGLIFVLWIEVYRNECVVCVLNL